MEESHPEKQYPSMASSGKTTTISLDSMATCSGYSMVTTSEYHSIAGTMDHETNHEMEVVP